MLSKNIYICIYLKHLLNKFKRIKFYIFSVTHTLNRKDVIVEPVKIDDLTRKIEIPIGNNSDESIRLKKGSIMANATKLDIIGYDKVAEVETAQAELSLKWKNDSLTLPLNPEGAC